MVMEISAHEEHLNGILNVITDGEQRATVIEHLEALRADYGSTVEEVNSLNSQNEKYKNENEALVISNSKLFREKAVTVDDKKDDEDEPNEDITLESLGI